MEIQCRACTSTTSTEYIDFMAFLDNGLSYLDYFNQLTQLNVIPDDGLPNTFCTNCCHDLQVSYDFTQVAKQANEVFKQIRQEESVKSEVNVDNIEYIQEENEAVCQIGDADNIEEEMIHLEEDDNIQISIISPDVELKNKSKNLVTCEEFIAEEHDTQEDIVAEEILECQEDEINVETIQFAEVDIDSLDELEEIENSEEKLHEILKDTQKDLKEVISSIDIDEYYPDDENDDEYLIEYDPNDLHVNSKNGNCGQRWRCTQCKKILRGDVSFEGHMNMHKDIRPFGCTQCQCAFRCKDSLKRHINQRHNEKSNTHSKMLCKYCQKQFRDSMELLNHECEVLPVSDEPEPIELKIIESGNDLVSCPHCKIKLHKEALADHIRSTHPNEDSKEQETSSDGISSLITELETYYNCKFCEQTFASFYEMRNHTKDAHPDRLGKNISFSGKPLEQCKVCGKKLLKQNINKHMEIHENPLDRSSTKYICAYCSRGFKNSKSLYHHEKVHKGEQPDVIYVCNECDRQYHSQYLMEQHRKLAHKERDHVCTICGNAFKLKNQLKNHMKLHLNRDIQCSVCDKKYARIFDLNVHMRTHTGEQPYACHLCDKRFAIKVRLTYHLQKHYGIKHRCRDCGAEFNSKQKLKAHSFKHTGMPYVCEMCNDHGFSNRDVFKRHLLRVHKSSMSDEDLRAMFQKNTGKTTIIQTVDSLDIDILPASTENPTKEDSVEDVDIG